MSKKRPFYFFIICCSLACASYAQDSEEELKSAIKLGSSKELSVFFKDEVEITIQDEKQIYKKEQAEAVMKKFFTQYPPIDFQIIHKGTSKEGLKYIIGQYKYAKGIFQTVVFLKLRNASYTIHTLQFNED